MRLLNFSFLFWLQKVYGFQIYWYCLCVIHNTKASYIGYGGIVDYKNHSHLRKFVSPRVLQCFQTSVPETSCVIEKLRFSALKRRQDHTNWWQPDQVTGPKLICKYYSC